MTEKAQKGGVPIHFIIYALKEHEKKLDRFISELSEITALARSETGELTEKLERIEERMTSVQTQIASCDRSSSSTGESSSQHHGFPVVFRFEQWEDFKAFAGDAETVALRFNHEEGLFQTDALKNGRFLTYSGKFPHDVKLLKLWLSRELNVAEEKILEGVLMSTLPQTTGKVFCRFCGFENKTDALFCVNCGKKLAQYV